MKTSMERLDRIAMDYHTNASIPDIHIENACQRYFVGWLLGQVPSGSRVLELGYGDGLVTAALASAEAHLTVLEGAKILVEKACALHPTVECIHSLFEDHSPATPYDLILASHVLEHVDDPQAILHLVAGWLAKSGSLIVVVPNRNSLHRQLAVLMGLQPALETLSTRDLLVGHQRVYSMESLVTEIRRAGFEVKTSRGFFLKTLPNSMMLEYSESLLNALNVISDSLPEELLANLALTVSKP